MMYKWKALTDDGLLKEPEYGGYYDSRDSINTYSGFETPEEAETKLKEFNEIYKYHNFGGELILVMVP